MKKLIPFLWVWLHFAIPSHSIFAQEYQRLNQYRYFVVEADDPYREHASDIRNEIIKFLQKKDFPVYVSRNAWESLGVDTCQAVKVLFEVQVNRKQVPNYLTLDLFFLDCDRNVLYSFQENKSSFFIFMKTPFIKATQKIVEPLRKFRYEYTGIPLSRPSQTVPLHSQMQRVHQGGPSDVDQDIPQTRHDLSKAVAVVIGNHNYRHPDVPPVDFALQDAQTLRQYLQGTFGYRDENILYYENATQAQMNALFGTSDNHRGILLNYTQAEESDIFIYYSGHGMPDPGQKGAYLVPVDCDPSLVNLNGYSLKILFNNLAKIPYKSLTLVIDACFSGSSERGMLIRQASPIYIKTQNKLLLDPKSHIFFSSSGSQISSWYPEQKHSLFTYFLLKGIQGEANLDRDGKLLLSELANYIEQEVNYKAWRLHKRKQTPEIYGPRQEVFLEY